MKRTMLFVLAASVSFSIAHESDAQVLSMPTMTVMKDGATTLEDGSGYDVQNSISKNFLGYKSQGTFGGINLGWLPAKSGSVSFKKQGGGTINYGDAIAIKVEGGGFIQYKSRDYGINLNWSKDPVYEWRIDGGSGPVKLGVIKLFNTVAKDNVTYCWRKNGAWLKWEKDCSQKDIAAAKAGVPSL